MIIPFTAAKGIDVGPTNVTNYQPVCKKSVCYIAAAVIFYHQNLPEKNRMMLRRGTHPLEDDEAVLMMQEAKSECAGTWYLPAGRVEPGETLIEAVKREVKEETGLEFNPLTLVMVENAKGSWFRFVFTGSITGGQLKTVSRADAESICADWISDLSCLSLRHRDILPVIEKARNYWRAQNDYHNPILPVSIKPYRNLLLSLLLVVRKKEK